MQDPLIKFNQWWLLALENSPQMQKSAVCVTTIDEQGFPASRYVDLKAADDQGFAFCTHLHSHKARHIQANPKGAMAIWWDHLGLQVRVKGKLRHLPVYLADKFWRERGRDAQLTSISFQQSQPLESEEELEQKLKWAQAEFTEKDIERPDFWGGFQLLAHEIEFLTFEKSRLHLRELYRLNKKDEPQWHYQLLQP